MFSTFSKKRCRALTAAIAFSFAAVSFSGCSADIGSSSSSSGSAASSASSSGIMAVTNAPAVDTSEISDARNTPVVRAAKAIGPTVVGITNKAVARDWFNNPVETEGVGSGVIFRADGYIVTNNHVIEGAKELIVSLADGRTLKGKLIGADSVTDLAVVKVDAKDLPVAAFGDSDQIVVGEPAIAIGNPMGLEFQGSVTSGVISALNRTLDISDRRVKLLQTDAAISPGNSGGALVNADGQVIGINSAKVAASGVEGMGFSIPINTVRSVVAELMDKGYVARPYLGVSVFDPESAARYGYQLNIDKGVFVFKVTLDGPAGKAGIQRGDIILKIDGAEVNTVSELRAKVGEHAIGDTVNVTIDRNGHERDLSVTLEEVPQDN
ncbi:trypsin-like peptidase domain-containing protein [Selenomonas sp.]|uniref:S1C family serine protease n=1 Tax=Selenomonas sp. TaxID=2053611 RepID=UPI0025F6F11C|nr:trypsin-like peptidase domain-containing protein [Selenomonas sp.]MCI6285107.1 trypsin-like peptidase domain-containing protein [Selenomonas sp.]